MKKKYAVLADIHGNVWALQAVLKHAKQKGIETFLNLGDILYGPLEPKKTFAMMKNEKMISVRGNQDRQIYEAGPHDLVNNPTLEYVVNQLNPESIDYLKGLPKKNIVDAQIYIFHGTPGQDSEYLLEDISSGHPVIRREKDILPFIGNVAYPVICCGHSHIPNFVMLSTGQLIINPGSVGLQAYCDEQPVIHRMENHSPYASYAILEKNRETWSVSFHKIPYDNTKAVKKAVSLKRDDWAFSLKTGRSQ